MLFVYMKAMETKAPDKWANKNGYISVFLAGSIEQGAAEDWQQKCVDTLKDYPIHFINPRRDSWDSSWEQSINNEKFKEQVTWELDGLDAADFIILFFDKETKSPISLLELGIHASSNPKKLLVVCPEGFWRKGNVDIVCERYKVKQFDNLDELLGIFKIN